MTTEPPAPNLSVVEIEAELEGFFDTLAEPAFVDQLKDLAVEIVNSQTVTRLDMVDITSTLSKQGTSWIGNIEWDSTDQSFNISNMISVIEKKGLNINSAQKKLIWFKLGSKALLAEINTFNEGISLIGNEDSEFVYGYGSMEGESQLNL